MRGRLFWKLFLGNAALMTVVLTTCVWLLLAEFDRFHSRELTPYLKGLAATIQPLVEGHFSASTDIELRRLAKKLGDSVTGGVRVTFISADGRVLGDSHAEAGTMDFHGDRPEIQQAIVEGWGESTRWSNTVSREMKYVALRVGDRERPQGFIRVAVPQRSIVAQTQSLRRLGWGIAISAIVAAGGLALGLALLWSRRISRLTSSARSLSRGDLSARVDASGSDEVALLARSINRMRDRLAAHTEATDRHRKSLEMLLSRLGEGVVVIGTNGRVLLMNPAARRLLNLSDAVPDGGATRDGWTVEQCVPQHELQRLLLDPIPYSLGPEETSEPAEVQPAYPRELRLDLMGRRGDITVLARVSSIALTEFDDRHAPTRHSPAVPTGRLLILTDITELTHAIKMKTDFVANASHELRTPVAAIRAAVETLLKLEFPRDADFAKRFLEVIGRHSNRLEALASDLLALSRVESPAGRFQPTTLRVNSVRDDLHERWRDAIGAKGLHWNCEVSDGCHSVSVNAYLLNLVLDNLVDNAIKFTESGRNVRVSWRKEEECHVIDVSDEGCGIPQHEHERVFERFYQATPSKSGSSGKVAAVRGTGLGLSIVRHAVAAMGGSVRLTSAVGRGTTITFTIP